MTNRRTSVLMVEDEVLISELMTEILSENGFAVHAVPDAKSALDYLDAQPNVDVLFTDINLLGPMDGSTLAQHARARRPDLPIVYCSGRYAASDLSPPMPRSIFLAKPYNPSDVCTLLERLTSTSH